MSKGAKLFQVASTLDMSGVTDADLALSTTTAQKPRLLREPGVYNFTVSEVKVLDGRVDGAGKKWGSLLVVSTENTSGNIQKAFVDYPIEAALYTSKTGNTSTVKTKIFTTFLSSILGRTVKAAELPKIVASIENTVKVGANFRASVKYMNDHIERTNTNDTPTYRIRLADGTIAVDENGDELVFGEYDAATNYYQQVKGYKIKSGMDISSFLPRVTEVKAAV